MAVYFQLTPRCDPEHGPMSINAIDEGIASFIGEPVHPKRYCCQWYDAIAFWIAWGFTWQQIDNQLLSYVVTSHDEQERMEYVKLVAISQFLQANYLTNNWYGR